MSTTLPRCAVIGAGSSGITAAKELREKGLDVTVFEASDRVGGNWVLRNVNSLAGRYRPPARTAMAADTREDLAEMRKRHIASKWHTIQVDFEGYLRDLDRERKAGAQRAAAAAGFVPPLPHRRPAVPA
jgi:cation diffusion facilitator CzcD-associated flavoprotein CzcO